MMFTTLDFWLGVLWGAAVMGLFLWYWMIRPMGRLLGFEDETSNQERSRSDADVF